MLASTLSIPSHRSNFFYLPPCVLRAEYGILHGMNPMEQSFNLRLSNLWLMISHGSCVV